MSSFSPSMAPSSMSPPDSWRNDAKKLSEGEHQIDESEITSLQKSSNLFRRKIDGTIFNVLNWNLDPGKSVSTPDKKRAIISKALFSMDIDVCCCQELIWSPRTFLTKHINSDIDVPLKSFELFGCLSDKRSKEAAVLVRIGLDGSYPRVKAQHLVEESFLPYLKAANLPYSMRSRFACVEVTYLANDEKGCPTKELDVVFFSVHMPYRRSGFDDDERLTMCNNFLESVKQFSVANNKFVVVGADMNINMSGDDKLVVPDGMVAKFEPDTDRNCVDMVIYRVHEGEPFLEFPKQKTFRWADNCDSRAAEQMHSILIPEAQERLTEQEALHALDELYETTEGLHIPIHLSFSQSTKISNDFFLEQQRFCKLSAEET